MSVSVYRLSIQYNTAGQYAQNVLHYQFDDSLFTNSVLAAAALNNAWNTHCAGALKDCLSTHTQILSLKSRKLTGGGGFEAVRLGVAGDIGTRTGDLSASGLAPVIRFITNATPPITGRIFLPGISDTDATDGFISAPYFTDMTTLAGVLDDNLTLSGGGAPVATPGIQSFSPVRIFTPITIGVPSPYLSTQRKRQRPA